MLSPACDAVIEHTPTDTSVTLVPETVQIAVELLTKPTVKPDEAVATKVTGPALTAVSAG